MKTGKISQQSYINDRIKSICNKSIKSALQTVVLDNKGNRVNYTRKNLKYDTKTGFITIKSITENRGMEFSFEPTRDDLTTPQQQGTTSTPLTRPIQLAKKSGPSSITIDGRSFRAGAGGYRSLSRIPDFPDELNHVYTRWSNICSKNVEYIFNVLGSGDELLTRKEMLSRNDAKEWKGAEKVEYDAILANSTIKFIKREDVPKGAKIIKCKWVYKQKPDRYKARLVVKGFMQSLFDYGETYAPVSKFSTVRSLIAHAALKGYKIKSLDIGNAYLHAYLPENEVCYMECPEGFKKPGYVCKIVKSLYGW